MEFFFKHAPFLSLRMFEYRQAKSAIYGSHQHTECPKRLVEGCSGCAKTYRTNRPATCDFPARSVVGPCKPRDGISTFHDVKTIPCLVDHSIHPPASLPPWPLLWPAPQASLLLALLWVSQPCTCVWYMAYGCLWLKITERTYFSPISLYWLRLQKVNTSLQVACYHGRLNLTKKTLLLRPSLMHSVHWLPQNPRKSSPPWTLAPWLVTSPNLSPLYPYWIGDRMGM